ncbi:hypothetical protein [Leifsonia sp. RAF41]|uniref:hypothetical protein n=1 Tax=Leifsonia sp. RAF41 TaxID=3233056 RepID=UPI003F9B889C
MIESKLRPQVVLWWGIGLTVGGLLATTVLPRLAYGMMPAVSGANGVDQGLLTGLAYIVQLITQIVPPLGVALIGASVVMAYVRRLLAPVPDRVVTGNEKGAAPVE